MRCCWYIYTLTTELWTRFNVRMDESTGWNWGDHPLRHDVGFNDTGLVSGICNDAGIGVTLEDYSEGVRHRFARYAIIGFPGYGVLCA